MATGRARHFQRLVACWGLVARVASGVLGLCALACGSRSGLDGVLGPPERFELPSTPLLRGVPDAGPAPEPEPEPEGCVDITRSYASTPPSVMLLIDQSASMNERFGQSTRWDVLRQAIIDEQSGLLTWLDDAANIGIMLYSSLDGFRQGFECPLIESVPTRFDGALAIREFYAEREPRPGGDTPTADGIDVATDSLVALGAGPAMYVLLLTDGVPDTCAEPDPQNGLEPAVAAVQRAYSLGVKVRTVGVSPEIARDGLQRMANAGAGKDPALQFGRDADAEEPFYASTDPRELADQLKGAIGDVRSCTVDLGADVGPARARDGSLVLDGASLHYGTPDGWRFVDEDTIAIDGAACQRILGAGEQLVVHFPCVEAAPDRELY